MDKYTIIVDPYYSHLVRELIDEGHVLIAVITDNNPRFTIDESLFCKVIYFDGKVGSLLGTLSVYSIRRVINGFDTGSRLWVKLMRELTPMDAPNVGVEEILNNKYAINRYLFDSGFNVDRSYVIKTNAIEKLDELERSLEFPVVLKPTESGGSFGVYICGDVIELKERAHQVLNSVDNTGNLVKEVVIEPYYVGIEYSVCVVSSGGKHNIIAVCEYEESIENGIKNLRYTKVLKPEHNIYLLLSQFSRKILDTLGFKVGQFLIEAINTEEGLKLIEVNCRVSGLDGILDVLLSEVQGVSQKELAAKIDLENHFEAKEMQFGRVMFLNNIADVKRANGAKIDLIKDLKTVYSVHPRYTEGTFFPKTVDVLSSPIIITLVSESDEEIQSDIEEIKRLEMEGILY